MAVSQKKGNPIWTPKYSEPHCGDPQKVNYPEFWESLKWPVPELSTLDLWRQTLLGFRVLVYPDLIKVVSTQQWRINWKRTWNVRWKLGFKRGWVPKMRLYSIFGLVLGLSLWVTTLCMTLRGKAISPCTTPTTSSSVLENGELLQLSSLRHRALKSDTESPKP